MLKRTAAVVLAVTALLAGVAAPAAAQPVGQASGTAPRLGHTVAEPPHPVGLPIRDSGQRNKSGAATKVAGIQNLQYIRTYKMVNTGTGRCLDAFYSYGGGNGNPVGLWACNGGWTEEWHVYTLGLAYAPYSYVFKNARTNRCLDYPGSSGGSNGWQYQTWDCYYNAGQRFRLDPHPSGGGTHYVSNMLGGSANVMDAFQSGGGGDGNPVGNWVKTGSTLQAWRFDYLYG
jgi:hypothetical protein